MWLLGAARHHSDMSTSATGRSGNGQPTDQQESTDQVRYPPSGGYATRGSYPPPEPLWESQARTIAALTHVSAFFLPVIGPLIALVVFKGRSLLVEHHAKEQLNLAISLFLYTIFAVVGTIATLGLALIAIVPLLIVVPIAAFVLTIVAAISAGSGEYYRFPFIMRLIPEPLS
jgi:uncharacterized Tic20 family protein